MKQALIIENEPEQRLLLREMMESLDYETFEASDGESGLKKVSKIKPDIVLLDIGLVRMDGFEVCRKIKNNPELKSIPVLMLTGEAIKINSQVKGLDLGAEDYILKPFTTKLLAARVEAIMNRIQINKTNG